MFRKRSLVYSCKSFHEKEKNESLETTSRKTTTMTAAGENGAYRVRNAFLRKIFAKSSVFIKICYIFYGTLDASLNYVSLAYSEQAIFDIRRHFFQDI